MSELSANLGNTSISNPDLLVVDPKMVGSATLVATKDPDNAPIVNAKVGRAHAVITLKEKAALKMVRLLKLIVAK